MEVRLSITTIRASKQSGKVGLDTNKGSYRDGDMDFICLVKTTKRPEVQWLVNVIGWISATIIRGSRLRELVPYIWYL
jgi:hypothetical protein